MQTLTKEQLAEFIERNENRFRMTLVSKYIYSQSLENALDIVKKYISVNKKIIVGGTAIDMALRLKGDKIYDVYEVPDYDVISPKFHIDAYNLTTLLAKSGYKKISTINALHTSTMRVRIDFIVVADITYVPVALYRRMRTLKYKNFLVVHPHYQLLDQHLNLSHPLKNPPLESFFHRWKKDMHRYDMLYKYYPIEPKTQTKKQHADKTVTLSSDVVEHCCFTGIAGLLLWVNEAVKDGRVHKFPVDLGSVEVQEDGSVTFVLPGTCSVDIYTNDLNALNKRIKGKDIFMNAVLDKVPRRIIKPTAGVELFDNHDVYISAHKHNHYHVANLQHVMCVLLTKHLFGFLYKPHQANHALYAMYYLQCREMLQWAVLASVRNMQQKYLKYLPTLEFYGENNVSESFKAFMYNFEVSMRMRQRDPLRMPSPIYVNLVKDGKLLDADEKKKLMSDEIEPMSDALNTSFFRLEEVHRYKMTYLKYDPAKSPLYQFDGAIVDEFPLDAYSLRTPRTNRTERHLNKIVEARMPRSMPTDRTERIARVKRTSKNKPAGLDRKAPRLERAGRSERG